ncbi:MAG: TRASH domain-containing protein [Candidatus Aenigmarchaeota archaeon]|nr:TRASH domain-containing protein [Candidatus Aenigmarchaeota archaeon]
MVNCSFCGKKIERGSGKMVVKNSGKIFYFCSSKCEKNLLKLKRAPKKLS